MRTWKYVNGDGSTKIRIKILEFEKKLIRSLEVFFEKCERENSQNGRWKHILRISCDVATQDFEHRTDSLSDFRTSTCNVITLFRSNHLMETHLIQITFLTNCLKIRITF
ncbi:unnamed protein product [Boreogadus saida]